MTQALDLNDADTIQRCPHDKENPYVMVSRHLVRDQSLSPGCRWLLIYLLSNQGSFKINIKTIINHLKPHKGYGRDSVRAMIVKLCEVGYMKREWVRFGSRYGGIKYFVSEVPKFQGLDEEFKKMFPKPGFPSPVETSPLRKNKDSSYEESSSKETTTLPTLSQGSSMPPKSSKNDDVVSEENLRKALKKEEFVKRGLEYYAKNKEQIHAKATKSLVGYVVDAIRNDRDLQNGGHLSILDKRMAFAKQVVEKYGEKYRIEMAPFCLMFTLDGAAGMYYISFKEDGFEEKVCGRLELMGIKFEPA